MAGLPGPGSDHGIYVYEGGSWRLLRRDGGAFALGELGDGVYLVYFDNLLCPACREQDLELVGLLGKLAEDGRIKFVVVLCDWFTEICDSGAAAETFKSFSVKASPTIVVAAVRGGRVAYREDLRGLKPSGVIELYLRRALNALYNPEG